MKLNLEKDLIVIDVETTGLSVSKDRIVQMAMIKVFADGRKTEERSRLINPQMPISSESTAIHGITDEVVKDEPTFKRLAKGILTFIGDSDLATYNGNRFDIPLIIQEFDRVSCPLDMSGRRSVDVQRIFHKMEPRSLSAAVKFYTGEKMVGAHDAGVDTQATLKVLLAQIKKYEGVDCDVKEEVIKSPIKNDIQALHDFTNNKDELDFQGKVKKDENGIANLTFGKYQGKPVGKSLHFDQNYYSWIMRGDFTEDTKKIITSLVNEYSKENK